MKNPEFITFTGADDGTNLLDLADFSRAYSAELGILFSPKRAGSARYPTLAWTGRLIKTIVGPLSAHICGDYSRALLRGERLPDEIELLLESRFDRVQINTAEPNIPVGRLSAWAASLGLQLILQCRDTFPEDNRAQWLFDRSGGRGEQPEHWPVPHPDMPGPVGYAGGIGPANVLDTLNRITTSLPFWIDMESGVRNAEDRFDIGRCRAVCEAVYQREMVA